MDEKRFEKFRKKCPWHYVGTNWDRTKRCLATDRGAVLDVTVSDWGLGCCRKNCAIWYWLKIERKITRN